MAPGTILMRATACRGPQMRRRPDRLPGNVPLPAAYRVAAELPNDPRTADPLTREAALAVVEAVLFAAEEPLPVRKIAQVAGLPDAALVRRLIKKLHAFYEQDGSAFQIEELAGGYQFLTRRE